MSRLNDTLTNRHDEMNHAEYEEMLIQGHTSDVELEHSVCVNIGAASLHSLPCSER